MILVLKDSRTIITDGTDRLYINTNGNSGMATGGSGDVLTGIMGGMLACKMDPFEAAAMAGFLHGRCGDEAAGELSEGSVMAGDLVRFLPSALKCK